MAQWEDVRKEKQNFTETSDGARDPLDGRIQVTTNKNRPAMIGNWKEGTQRRSKTVRVNVVWVAMKPSGLRSLCHRDRLSNVDRRYGGD